TAGLYTLSYTTLFRSVLLIVQGIEPGNGSGRSVVLESTSDVLSKVVAELGGGSKFHAFVHSSSQPGACQRLIEGQIPRPQSLIHNRPDLPGPGISREFAAHIAQLSRHTDSHRPMPRLGNPHPRANMVAHPLPAAVRLDAGED